MRMRAPGAVIGVVALMAGASTGQPAAASASTRPAATCVLRALSLPEGATDARVAAGDPTGRWLAGTSSQDDGSLSIAIWHDGVVQSLAVPFDVLHVTAVNRAGVVVGWGEDPSEPYISAFAVENGELTLLGEPKGGGHTWATGVSAAGTIVGFMYRPWPSLRSDPVTWSISDPRRLHAIRLPHGDQGTAEGISPRGEIVGRDLGDDPSSSPEHSSFVLDDRGLHVLMPADANATSTLPVAVANGVAVGYVHVDDGSDQKAMVRWNLRSGQPTLVAVGVFDAHGVNARGDIVGEPSDLQSAALVRGDTVTALPAAVVGGRSTARTVSNVGVVAGSAEIEGEHFEPVRWTCDFESS